MSDIIYGIHAVQALLVQNPKRFLEVYILEGYYHRRLRLLVKQLEQGGIVIKMARRQLLNEKVNGAVHQGVVARIRYEVCHFQEGNLPALLSQYTAPFLLVLDGITDPHNLGACLRCADAAGVHAVIVPHDRSAQLNAIAKKVASGAAETVLLIRVTNLVRTLCLLHKHNVWVVGTSCEAKNYFFQSNLTGPLALVVGNEGEGMRRLTKEYCDELISIPMAGSVPNLNVSVAAGICLFEAVQQRICMKRKD